MKTKHLLLLMFSGLLLVVLAPLLYAAPDAGLVLHVPDPATDGAGWLAYVYAMFVSHQAVGVTAALLTGLIWVVRLEKLKIVTALPWLTTRWGGWALNLGLSLVGWITHTLVIGQTPTGAGFLTALYASGGAAALWELIKDVKEKPVAEKAAAEATPPA